MNNEDMSGLDKAFETVEAVTTEVTPERTQPTKGKDEVQDDYEYARSNLYSLVDKGQEAVNGALDLAMSSDHPRAYEVAGNLIKQVADTVDKLQDLQGKLKTLKDVPNKTSTNIKQALFVGSSAELHKMLKNKNKNVTPEEDKTFKDGFNPEEHKYD